MNVKRFIGRNSREAMQKVRQAFGDNAVVLSTKPCSEGIEVLAMPPESVEAIERFGEAAVNQPVARQPSAAASAPQQRRPCHARGFSPRKARRRHAAAIPTGFRPAA